VDHVMGLFRLWWVPSDGSAADGAYVRYPYEDLLDIVALESHRAQAIVVGEDLGTVEAGVREEMAAHGILSYRLLWFEDDDPAQWPAESMAAVTTHDLPTVAGLWTGADLAEQRERGTGSDDELKRGRASLLEHLGGVAEGTGPADAVLAAYRRLATAPSTLLSATLDDAVAEERRPNMPGTTDRPNWCLPLPVPTEELAAHAGVQALAQVLAEGLQPKKRKRAPAKERASKGAAPKGAAPKGAAPKGAAPKKR
jgi:4-alpha-glucanotransferase